MDRSRGIFRGTAWLPLTVLAVSTGTGCMRQAQHAPDVWAVVDGREIKRDEVDKYYRTLGSRTCAGSFPFRNF